MPLAQGNPSAPGGENGTSDHQRPIKPRLTGGKDGLWIVHDAFTPTTTSALDMLIFLAYVASKHADHSPSGGQRCYRKVARQTKGSPSHGLRSPPTMSTDSWMNST